MFAFAGGASNGLFSSHNAWAVNGEKEGVELRSSGVGGSAGVLSFVGISDLAEDEFFLGDNGARTSSSPLNLGSWVSTGGAGLFVLSIISSLVVSSGDRRINV